MIMRVLVIGILMTGVSAYSANDVINEMVCQKVKVSGTADMGMKVIIQSTSITWAKRVSIVEIGYLGQREIGSFQIPLRPKSNFDLNNGWTLTYQTSNFQLTMKVNSTRLGFSLAGPAYAVFKLPNYEKMNIKLICK